MFLALYGKICFIAFILCRLKVDLLGSTYNYCKEDIFLYNIHIDAVIIMNDDLDLCYFCLHVAYL